MAYTSEKGRRQLLDDVIDAAADLARSLACLSEAYEALDEQTADRLEEQMFRPVQAAYGRARRTHTEFAGRYRLDDARATTTAPDGIAVLDPRGYIERAVEAVEAADQRIAKLQDSMLPVDVGDTEVRAGLSETRALIAEVPVRGRQILRMLGR
jgi:hypothetical protein